MSRRPQFARPAFPATYAHGGRAVWENKLPLGDPPPPEIELTPAGPGIVRIECENELDDPVLTAARRQKAAARRERRLRARGRHLGEQLAQLPESVRLEILATVVSAAAGTPATPVAAAS